jgi:hypothetical protein
MFQPGKPMLPQQKLSALNTEIQLLHNDVVAWSAKGERFYTADVPDGLGFVVDYPADKIYLEFESVINDSIFYVEVVRLSLMRLWSVWNATDPLLQNK